MVYIVVATMNRSGYVVVAHQQEVFIQRKKKPAKRSALLEGHANFPDIPSDASKRRNLIANYRRHIHRPLGRGIALVH